MRKIYVFIDKTHAQKFMTTAFKFGHTDIVRVGSALIMSDRIYQSVLEQTFAFPAAIVATQD